MTVPRIIPAKGAKAEIKISNSIFIATAAPVFSVEEAKKFIHDVRSEHASASHNVPVYIIGHPPSVIEHSSDDGEPSGTAGRPALAVLRGSGLGDICIVITRFFGGTKLGTGGLVRAYSDSVRAVLDKIIRAEKIVTISTSFRAPYNLYDRISRLVKDFDGNIINQNFEEEVGLYIKFSEKNFEEFNEALLELSNGSIDAPIFEKKSDDILPLKP